jgi:hypothetical protein
MSDRIAGLRVEISTEDFPLKKQECYPLGFIKFPLVRA